jgi:hypothetical protein
MDVLKTEDAIGLYACVFDYPVEKFDPEKMKLKQLSMLGGEPGTRDKDPMTEEQKEASMKAKNEP